MRAVSMERSGRWLVVGGQWSVLVPSRLRKKSFLIENRALSG
jgi:hypothetical protein